jgi:outer membrane protein assembly factor BamB
MDREPLTLRLWPGILFGALIVFSRFVLPLVWPDGVIVGVLGSILCGLAVMIWWAFFSRAPRAERWGGLALMFGALVATWALADVSIATGAMGMLVVLLAVPALGLFVPIAAVVSQGRPAATRRVSIAVATLLACGMWTLVRTDGMTSTALGSEVSWRWTPTSEERLLADAAAAPLPVSTAPAAPAPSPAEPIANAPVPVAAGEGTVVPPIPAAPAVVAAAWPGFRGAARDSVIRGVRIDTDWSATAPAALWRRPIGPGWSSFAVNGDLFYTQEQRGDEEIVAAYRVATGEPVWAHRDRVRFWESNGGAGPRATPTLGPDRLYAFGATGILNALDLASGAVIWSRDVAADSGVRVPDWGFSSSPLLSENLVIVAAAGKLMAYDRATGSPRWSGPDGGAGYSSPHAITIDGVPQVLLLTGPSATSVALVDGARLWQHPIPSSAMAATIVQPAVTAEGDILISDGQMGGMQRISVSRGPGGWTATERWTSNRLKPYFNDFVVHEGHAYGFDGTILACIDLADGNRKWKGGRYGNGQLMLLADQNLLLVTTEEGELALVSATPGEFKELARVPGIEGKTWNHPALAGNILLVRNGEQMAAFRLATGR